MPSLKKPPETVTIWFMRRNARTQALHYSTHPDVKPLYDTLSCLGHWAKTRARPEAPVMYGVECAPDTVPALLKLAARLGLARADASAPLMDLGAGHEYDPAREDALRFECPQGGKSRKPLSAWELQASAESGDCPGRSPVMAYVCCRETGHDGDHIGRTGPRAICARWPADDGGPGPVPPPVQPEEPRCSCGQATPGDDTWQAGLSDGGVVVRHHTAGSYCACTDEVVTKEQYERMYECEEGR